MTEEHDPHGSDAMAGPHASMDDHGGDHGHDDHGHGGETGALGPLDARSWGAGIVGILLGLAVAAAFVVAIVR